jgi:hypothetical protein
VDFLEQTFAGCVFFWSVGLAWFFETLLPFSGDEFHIYWHFSLSRFGIALTSCSNMNVYQGELFIPMNNSI